MPCFSYHEGVLKLGMNYAIAPELPLMHTVNVPTIC